MNYYPFHIGDYVSATRHLSWEEDAAFRRLLDTYYTTEKPIPADLRMACRLVMAQTDAQREAVRVVLEEFFALTDAGWVNKRADAEIAEMRLRQQKQRDKANKRWHKPEAAPGTAAAAPADAAAQVPDAVAVPPTPVPTPVPTPTVKDTPTPRKRGSASDPGFDVFWTAYPRKTAKAEAEKAWAKLAPSADLLDEILAAARSQSAWPSWLRDGGQYIPHPATWLNGKRWTDAAPVVAEAPLFESDKARAARHSVEAMTGGLVSIRPQRAAQHHEADDGRTDILALG